MSLSKANSDQIGNAAAAFTQSTALFGHRNRNTASSVQSTLDHHNVVSNNPYLVSDDIFLSVRETNALKSFILARKCRENAIELEKENAHFVLSEILIGAIEQMKWRNVISSNLCQRRVMGQFFELDCSGSSRLSDYASPGLDTTTSNSSPVDNKESSPSSCDSAKEDPGTSEETEHHHVYNTVSPMPDLVKDSAECIAAELLERFSKNHISPALASLNLLQDYLVSFEEAPQQLLPIPNSIPVSFDDVCSDTGVNSGLRGTIDWAPPRHQVIFNIHKPQHLKKLLIAQHNRCPGCGRHIESAYYKRLRYCSYFGKAFCQCCHKGDCQLIPARIIHKWDFKRRPVSDIASNFLVENSDLPLYDVYVLNSYLYKSVKALRQTFQLRQKLGFARVYLKTCDLAKEVVTKDGTLTQVFERFSSHLFTEPHLHSVKDFVEVYNGEMLKNLEILLTYATVHIESCRICQAKGFYCEICGDRKTVIFPFHSESVVTRCVFCGSCFHRKCFRKNAQCPKCQRIRIRKENTQDDDQ